MNSPHKEWNFVPVGALHPTWALITMVQTVEEHLVRLIKASGTRVVIPEKEQAALMADGPQIRDDNPNAVSGQDDVDDLLSSLGF